MGRMEGKVAAVTGGGAGIGAAICRHLAGAGATVVAVDVGAETGRAATPLDALVRLTDAEWRLVLGVHLDGTFFCSRAAARSMGPRGTGVIVNMASVCGIEGCAGHPHYSAAKAAILGFTRATATELIVQGIRVNAVAPGHVGTSTLHDTLDESRRVVAASTPAGRLADPDEVAGTVAFLASEDAGYFVGAV